MNFNLDKISFVFGQLIYLLSTRAYFLLLRCLAPFHQRAAALWNGQKNALSAMQADSANSHLNSIWFHVSSLGEFEQGKPIMEALQKKHPNYKLVVTFFSPSGYLARKENDLTRNVYYLPFESKTIAQKVIACLNPKIAVFVKYDLWYQYLDALKKQDIPVILISASFRPKQRFFKKNATFQRNLLKYFNFIFCQNQTSVDLLNSIGYTQCMVSGDTRFDRVSQHIEQAISIPVIEAFKDNNFLLLTGSSYSIEEQLLIEANAPFGSNRKLIIAPHFTTASRINEILTRFEPNSVSLTDLLANPAAHNDKKVLVIDRIGWLANLYQYADIAFIGGGFKENGLHNILEAASFGMPICFGPKIGRFPEAKEMVSLDLAQTVNDSKALKAWIDFYEMEAIIMANKSLNSRQWIQSKRGATQIILNWIQIHISL